MQRSTRRFLSLLAGSAVLAGCGDQIVGPQASAAARAALSCEELIPYSYSLYSVCNPGELEPVDPLDPGNGGGGTPPTPPPPFAPPPAPYLVAPLAVYLGGQSNTWYSCGQVTHPFWGLYSGWSQDVTQGTTIYASGIVVPNTRMNWGIYDQYGNLVASHLTQPSRNNCVVHHEPEGISTWGLAPGYYYLYASYMGLSAYGGGESSSGYITTIPGRYVGPLRVR